MLWHDTRGLLLYSNRSPASDSPYEYGGFSVQFNEQICLHVARAYRGVGDVYHMCEFAHVRKLISKVK